MESEQFRLSESGFSLIEVLIVVGLSTTLFGISNLFFSKMMDVEITTRKKFAILSVQTDLINSIRDKDAWQNTIQSATNISMDCLKNRIPCDAIANRGLLEVRDNLNVVVFNSANPQAGFDNQGQLCQSFDAENGNDRCPFRYEVYWEPTCEGACTNPAIYLRLTLLFKPATRQSPLNPANYSLVMYRDPIFDSLQQNCTSLNGVYDPITLNCTWTRVSSACSSTGQIFVGFDSNGNEVCDDYNLQSCPAGQWMRGFAADGTIVCQN